MEEEETKNIPGERWLSSRKRDRYFQGIQVRLAYFQTHLPLIKSLEGIPDLAEHYNGPSSEDIWLLMHHSLPNKEKDPGDIMLCVTFPNQQSILGLTDTGASCNLMPYAAYERLKPGELWPVKGKIEFADKSRM